MADNVDNDELSFVASNKGGRKLAHTDYLYTKQKENNLFLYWQCSKRALLDCKSILKTSVTLEHPMVCTYYT